MRRVSQGSSPAAPGQARGVVFNGKFLNAPARGLGRVAIETIRALDGLLAEQPARAAARSWEIACRTDARDIPGLRVIRRRPRSRRNWSLWEQTELPGLVGDKLLVNLCNICPLGVEGAITFIHDAHVFMMPQSHSLGYATWYRYALPRVARSASRVVTVSEFSRERLIEFGLAGRHGVEVIPNGADHLLGLEADWTVFERLGLGGKDFVLALANRQPHKNIAVLFEAFRDPAMAQMRLVLVGPHDAEAFARRGLAPPPQAVFAGHVSDQDLKALYEAAVCFCSPSLMEGFGLPAAEAMSLGCPVVASPRAALAEVCGDAALYADPADPEAWRRAVLSLTRKDGVGAALSAHSRLRAAAFTWRQGAERLLELIEEVAPAAQADAGRLDAA